MNTPDCEKEVQSHSRAEEATGSSERIVRYTNCARTGTADRGGIAFLPGAPGSAREIHAGVVLVTPGGLPRADQLVVLRRVLQQIGHEATINKAVKAALDGTISIEELACVPRLK